MDSDMLKVAIENKDNDNVKEWLSTSDIYKTYYIHGENLLHWCCAYDNLEICKCLVEEYNYPLDMSNSRGTTALYYGATNNSIETVNYLLKKYADVRHRSGFSGLFPKDITSNDELKKEIMLNEQYIPLDYDNNKKKHSKTMTQCYHYRLKRFHDSCLSMAYCKYNNVITSLTPDDKYSKKIMNTKTFDEIREMYEKTFNTYANTCISHEKQCANCGNTENLLKCSICRNIYFCDRNCQKQCHFLHRFDCSLAKK